MKNKNCNQPVKIYSKTYSKLPHFDFKNHYQFITCRTYDSVDSFLTKLYQQDIDNSKKQQDIDDYIDASKKGAYLNNEVLDFLMSFLKSKDKILYDLICFCIMPNHLHLLFKPLDELSVVMQKIKGG